MEISVAAIWTGKMVNTLMKPTHGIAAGLSIVENSIKLVMVIKLLVSMSLHLEQELSLSLLGLCSVPSLILPMLMVWQEMNGNSWNCGLIRMDKQVMKLWYLLKKSISKLKETRAAQEADSHQNIISNMKTNPAI